MRALPRRRAPVAAIAALALTMSACSFFQLSPATGVNAGKPSTATPATAKAPADTTRQAPKPAPQKPVEKPVEKTAEKPKPADKAPPRTAEQPKTAGAKAPPVAAAPPLARRPEPIVEPPAVEPPAAGSDSLGVARLVRAAALWDAVRLYHPAAAAQRVPWDNATVRRLTEIRVTRSAEQYSAALRDWVATLNDPATRIERAGTPPVASSNIATGGRTVAVTVSPIVTAPARGKKTAQGTDSTMVVTWPRDRATTDSAAWQSLRETSRNLRNVLRVVVDLRGAASNTQSLTQSSALAIGAVREAQLEVANNLASGPATGPAVRRRVYEGWDERPGMMSTAAGWRVSDPLSTISANGIRWSGLRHIVLIADSTTALPASLLALVSAQQATLVADNAVSDAGLVPVSTVQMGDGLVARVRTGELLNADGSIGIQPDTLVIAASTTDSSPALKVALQVARGAIAPHAARYITPASDPAMINSAWNTQHYPIMGARLLGAFKLWGTLRTFHAYNELHDEDLDETFTRIVPRVEGARDADGYAAAMLDFATAMDDAQGAVTGPSVTQHVGPASAPFRVRWIESRAIVTQIASEQTKAGGLSIGDELSAADGYPMPAYTSEHRRYGPASNDWTRLRNIMEMVPRGAAGEASFRVRDPNGRERPLTVQRAESFANSFPATERYATSPWRELAGGVGYIDLDRVTEQSVDSALNALAGTRALILDARTGRTISAAVLSTVLHRVSTQPRVVTDKEAVRIATEPCAPLTDASAMPCAVERRQFDNVLVADTARHYRGRTALLIDERTQGRLEQFALALESAAHTVLVGSPSAGASGALASLALPGQLTATFSGSEVRHADGRQLQRVGLTPQVDARPTVKGVRAGTDETIERAQQWLVQQLDPPVKRRR